MIFFFWVVYHFFYFNWASFFNKSICVNLYKLTFSIPNKIKMKEIKIFSMLLLFHSLTILYLYFFTPPIKQILKVFFFFVEKSIFHFFLMSYYTFPFGSFHLTIIYEQLFYVSFFCKLCLKRFAVQLVDTSLYFQWKSLKFKSPTSN